ncbi:MAG: hypothetical protein PHO15_04605 [Eubacteriales bacterium]|nr:hypothetical protein [Eubacteriales bacterium]
MLIDFEEEFSKYLSEYKFENDIDDEKLEAIAPELYLSWLETPKEWLSGRSPDAYFQSFDSAGLIEELGKYIFSDFKVPGVMLNRIADTKDETYPYLLALLKNYDGEKSDKIKTVVVRLIEEMDMIHPYDIYIDAIANSSEKSDFSEACAEELKNAGEIQKENLIAAYEASESGYASDCFLDILCDLPCDERIFQFALEKFLYSDDQKAFYASCLGKIGNENALPYLEEELKNDDIVYFDYMAMKNAYEELGGEISIERDFSGDKDYESLKDMGE